MKLKTITSRPLLTESISMYDSTMTLTNTLRNESSPYLLQHKDNPVHWQAWSDEAFDLAKKLDKPVFLSIGYATCHWCHVMEHDSFEDNDVAALMNDAFINIKVDREERPDIDQLYMTVCQLLTGAGGWPLTVIMTPDKRPFFAGTFFPKHSQPNRPGMLELIPAIKDAWSQDRQGILNSTQQILTQLVQHNQAGKPASIPSSICDDTYSQLSSSFDATHGGFTSAPKFPCPHQLLFLLRYYQRTHQNDALHMATYTLDMMMQGGIYDHVGFGFHRYATDSDWHLPHFEKMLYDQAQLLQAYALAYRITKKHAYARVIDDVITYMNRDLRSDTGAYFCAEDADSDGEEGTFYVWDYDELLEHISVEERAFLTPIFGLDPAGNFNDEATHQPSGKNIFHQQGTPETLAQAANLSADSMQKKINALLNCLNTARQKRNRPLLDDKILSDWNGLAIAGLADAYQATQKQAYLDHATTALTMILNSLQPEPGTLLHRYRNGNAGIQATAFDYHYLIYGILRVYAVTHEPEYLKQALLFQQTADTLFWDNATSGYFISSDKDLLIKQQDSYDGAQPAANSVAYHNLLFLSTALHEPDFYTKAQALMQRNANSITQYPQGHTFWLQAYEQQLHELTTLVCTHTLSAEQRAELSSFPNVLIQDLQKHTFFKTNKRFSLFKSIDEKPTFFLCHNQSCSEAPSFQTLMKSLRDVSV